VWWPQKNRIIGNAINHHGFMAGADLVADGGFDLQLAAWSQAEIDVVEHAADDPAIFGNASDRRKAHAGGTADDIENGRNGIDTRDDVNVVLEIVCHVCPGRDSVVGHPI
jgi:hypothetical protein